MFSQFYKLTCTKLWVQISHTANGLNGINYDGSTTREVMVLCANRINNETLIHQGAYVTEWLFSICKSIKGDSVPSKWVAGWNQGWGWEGEMKGWGRNWPGWQARMERWRGKISGTRGFSHNANGAYLCDVCKILFYFLIHNVNQLALLFQWYKDSVNQYMKST